MASISSWEEEEEDILDDEEIIANPMEPDAEKSTTNEASASNTIDLEEGNSKTNSRKGADHGTTSLNASRHGGPSIPTTGRPGTPQYISPTKTLRARSKSPTNQDISGKCPFTSNGSSAWAITKRDKTVRSKSYSPANRGAGGKIPHESNCSSVGGTVTSVKVTGSMSDSLSKKGLRGNAPVRSISPSPAALRTISPDNSNRGLRNDTATRGLRGESPFRKPRSGTGRLSPTNKSRDQTDSPSVTSPSTRGTVSPVKMRRRVTDSRLTNKVPRGRSTLRSSSLSPNGGTASSIKTIGDASDNNIATNGPRVRKPFRRLTGGPGSFSPVKVTGGMSDSLTRKGLRGKSPLRSSSLSPTNGRTVKKIRAVSDNNIATKGPRGRSPIGTVRNGAGSSSPVHNKTADRSDSPVITSPANMQTNRGFGMKPGPNPHPKDQEEAPMQQDKSLFPDKSHEEDLSCISNIDAGLASNNPPPVDIESMTGPAPRNSDLLPQQCHGDSAEFSSTNMLALSLEQLPMGASIDNFTGVQEGHDYDSEDDIDVNNNEDIEVHNRQDSYISYADESPPSDNDASSIHKNSLDDESLPSSSHDNTLPEDNKNEGDLSSLGSLPRPYLSYLYSASPPNSNQRMPLHEFEPMPMPTNDTFQQQHPGAYAEALGTHLERLDHVRFSLVGVEHGYGIEDVTDVINDDAGIEVYNHNDYEDAGPEDDDDVQEDVTNHNDTFFTFSPHHIVGLAEATPVEDSVIPDIEAEPFDVDASERRKLLEARKHRANLGLMVIIVMTAVPTVVALVLRNNKDSNFVVDIETPTTTSPSTSPLPPMEHLELIYDGLPEKTKESLYSNDSPQYQAWEWLLNHPNITTYPEWRKKQVFAMVAFYYSFGGPNWPEQIQTRWLDVTTNECSWVLSDMEVTFFAKQSADIFGDAYGLEDFRPCNEEGQLQTLLMHNLNLPTGVGPVVLPPEIGLLTSVRILVITLSQINGKLSDSILVPELIGLPNLLLLSLHGAGISGSIPTLIGTMTRLKILVLGGNDLSGSIPTEIGEMTSLEVYSHDRSPGPGLKGRLPTELGLLTQLTALSFGMNSHTGQIPSQIGLLTQIRELGLWDNKLSGSLPSQLGLLERMTGFHSESNLLSGTIPSELALLSNARILFIGGNVLTAEIPSELGLMTNMKELHLGNNALVGGLPSQLGKMTNLVELWLGNELLYTGPYVNFTGSFPLELWELSNVELLYLPNLPNLSGSFPAALNMPNLTKLSISGSPQLSGTIPEQACLFIEELDFDCSDMLCGCDCPCT